MSEVIRCDWCLSDPLYRDYHDLEWGNPEARPRVLFEFLILEGAQAGLSWITILKKRAHYRTVFDQFDPRKIVHYDDSKKKALLADSGIVRNRLKVDAAISNARAYLEAEESGRTFPELIWSFVDGRPIQNHWKTLAEIPAETDISSAMSKELKRLGFRFVGPTICYAFMQAMGLVNDHVTGCYRHGECKAMSLQPGGSMTAGIEGVDVDRNG